MLQLKEITFGYNRKKQNVLQHFSLSFQSGAVYGLLGKNGAGKSTLLYLMSGLLTPRKGQALFKGQNIRLRQPAVLQELFIVPEEFNLPNISMTDYVKLNSPFYPRFSQEDMKNYLQCFGMEFGLNLGSLSMGQKKKVFMSFALATNTSVLLMDEPTNGLDIPGKSQFRKFIASGMSDDKTIIISTHQVRDIDKVLDHVVIMDESKVLLDQSLTEISKTLLFIESDDRNLLDKAIYPLPSVQSNWLLLPNEQKEDTEINLELLFGATTTHPDKIATMFHTQISE